MNPSQQRNPNKLVPHPPKFPSKSFTRLSTKHCKQDLTCKHCCSCWLKYKHASQINQQNKNKQIQVLHNQIQMLENVNKELNRSLNEKTRKLSKLNNIEAYEQEIKQSLLQEVKKQVSVELQANKMRISELTENMKIRDKEIEKLIDQNRYYTDQINKYKQTIEQQQCQLTANKSKIIDLQQSIQDLSIKLSSKVAQNTQLQQYLQNKTQTITKMQQIIKKSEDICLIEKNKANTYQFEKNALEIKVRNKDDCIKQLTKCSQGNLKSIASLTTNNRELKDMVLQMDTEIQDNIFHENYLQQRLKWTQNVADLQNMKVNSIKSDLRSLKMTL